MHLIPQSYTAKNNKKNTIVIPMQTSIAKFNSLDYSEYLIKKGFVINQVIKVIISGAKSNEFHIPIDWQTEKSKDYRKYWLSLVIPDYYSILYYTNASNEVTKFYVYNDKKETALYIHKESENTNILISDFQSLKISPNEQKIWNN